MQKTTEFDSNYDALEKMSTANLLKNINREDKTVSHSVANQIPQIEKLVNVNRFQNETWWTIVLFRSRYFW